MNARSLTAHDAAVQGCIVLDGWTAVALELGELPYGPVESRERRLSAPPCTTRRSVPVAEYRHTPGVSRPTADRSYLLESMLLVAVYAG